MLQLAMVNTMDQWVKDYTRYTREEPSVLDIIFTKKQCPVLPSNNIDNGKSYHVVLEIELEEQEILGWDEGYKQD